MRVLTALASTLNMLIAMRRSDIVHKKPGTIDSLKHPKIVWVEMIQHPFGSNTISNKIFAQQEKFNYIFKNTAKDAKHYTLTIDICQPKSTNFDIKGNLSNVGKAAFWREFIYYFRKFDRGEISLHPTSVLHKDCKTSSSLSHTHH